jgi:hypothetical protein
MSIEIYGGDVNTGRIAGRAGLAGARSLETEGVEAGTAYVYGSRAGIHAAEILLIALRENGNLVIEDINFESLEQEITRIEDDSGITDEIKRLRNEESEFFRLHAPFRS